MTPNQLLDVVRRRYNAVGDTFYSDTELFSLMYAAHLEFARETLCIERVYSTTSVTGQREYSYPTNTISIKRVTYDGLKLDPVTFVQDDYLTGYNSNTTSTGTPRYYSIWNNTLYLRDAPDTDALEIKIFGYNEPQEVTSISTFEIPTMFHMETINYVLSEMYAKDKDFNASRYYKDLWNLALQNGKKWMKKSKVGDGFVSVQNVERDFYAETF